MSSRSSWNCSLIDSLSRMRMTASSPCTLGMIETRKSIVLPGMRSLKRPSCGTRFSAMSSSAMTLMREMIVLWKLLVDRPHRRLQHAVDPVLHVDRVVLRLDVDVAGAALDGACRCVVSTSRMTGLSRWSACSTVSCSSPSSSSRSSCSWKLSVASSSTRCELSLFLRIDSIAERRADRDLDRRRQQHRRARRSSAGRSGRTRR